MNKIAIIGCGNIGISIAEGLCSNGQSDQQVTATRRNTSRIAHLEAIGVTISSDNAATTAASKYIILAVKPYKMEEILKELQPVITPEHVVISVASEISIRDIRQVIGDRNPVFRVMPNTASSINESITCVAHDRARAEDIETVNRMFECIGEVIIIEEKLMEAATILGACGIAYVLRFIRAMIQGGIQIGFDSATATKIATQTVKGAAELLLQKNTHPEAEIDKVTTPKGCTITGLNEMEHQGFSSALIKGITTSFQKIEH